MSEESDWIRNLIPPEQVEQIESRSRRIIDSDGTYYEMNIMMSEEDMIAAVHNMYRMRRGDMDSWFFGISMLASLVSTMEMALRDAGVDFTEEM